MTEKDRSSAAVEDDLETLDDWRSSGFEGHRRAALALARRAEENMTFLSPDRLLALAESRGCHSPLPACEAIESALRDDYEAGETLCRDLAQRIVDTALFGCDLIGIELHRLVEIAYTQGIEHGRMIGDWRSHEDLVASSRQRLRHCEVFLGSLGLEELPQRNGSG